MKRPNEEMNRKITSQLFTHFTCRFHSEILILVVPSVCNCCVHFFFNFRLFHSYSKSFSVQFSFVFSNFSLSLSLSNSFFSVVQLLIELNIAHSILFTVLLPIGRTFALRNYQCNRTENKNEWMPKFEWKCLITIRDGINSSQQEVKIVAKYGAYGWALTTVVCLCLFLFFM